MNHLQQNREQSGKRLYRKPQVIQVPLRPDEAVLGSCKTAGGSTAGPGNSDCRTPAQCFSAAS